MQRRRACTGSPVATWRDTQRAHESFRKRSLGGEATLKRDVGYRRHTGSEKFLRQLQPLHGQILVNGMPRGILERAGEVVLAQARNVRQLFQVELPLEIRSNEFTDTP